MNARLVELALKKQRLQFRSEALRERWQGHARGLCPVFDGVDRLGDGARWLWRHPEVFVATAVALLVARPRAAWRWLRRGFVGWQVWRRGRAWLTAR